MSAPTRDGVIDRLNLAVHTWGKTVPARYAEALVAVNEAAMAPKLTDSERLGRIRTVLAAFAHVNVGREKSDDE